MVMLVPFQFVERGARREGTEMGLEFPWKTNKIGPVDVSDYCDTG